MAVVLSSPRLRLSVLGLIVVGGSLAFLVGVGPSRGELEVAVRSAGPYAPAAFVVSYAVLTVLLVPATIPTLVGGAIYGTVAGSALTVLGATIGSTASFWIGQGLGRSQLRRIAGKRSERLDGWLSERGFLALLYARLIPVVPFSVLHYAAGTAGLRFRHYLPATVLGIIPGTVAYTLLGSSVQRPRSVAFLVSVGSIALLTVLVSVIGRRRRAAPRSEPAHPQAARR
ncbi:MAG: TVP38/TMEM64 family protein [Thermoleophilaceae bacterium]